jgi:hypothetical protein
LRAAEESAFEGDADDLRFLVGHIPLLGVSFVCEERVGLHAVVLRNSSGRFPKIWNVFRDIEMVVGMLNGSLCCVNTFNNL